MRNWSRRHTLAAGLVLILLTNAAGLGGVAYNRSGDPDSVLTLTQRELRQPYPWGLNRENSGIALQIRWRNPSKGGYSEYYSGGSPDWLGAAKMASLGFDVNPPAGADADLYRWVGRQLSKEVLVVLEMDGPAYRQALERARQDVREQEALLAHNPDNKAAHSSVNAARETLAREENANSRLFAVDAGLDRAALRARFPDRTRYAIARAEVHLTTEGSGGRKIVGYLGKLSVDEINVPYQYHAMFERGESASSGKPAILLAPLFEERGGTATFQARIAFGQRLEPWLLSVNGAAKSGVGEKPSDDAPTEE